MPNIAETKQILQMEGHLDAVNLIESLESSVSRKAELLYLKQFAFESCFDEELSRDQLRCLWTAYCFHQSLDVDTASYDSDLREVWQAVAETEQETADWADFDSFDAFMGKWLV